MKKSIFIDRLRRKEITMGNLADNEYFMNLDMDKKD